MCAVLVLFGHSHPNNIQRYYFYGISTPYGRFYRYKTIEMFIETLQNWKLNWRKSNLRLLVLSSFYALFLVIGASVFSAIEGPPERELVKELRDIRSDFLQAIEKCVTGTCRQCCVFCRCSAFLVSVPEMQYFFLLL